MCRPDRTVSIDWNESHFERLSGRFGQLAQEGETRFTAACFDLGDRRLWDAGELRQGALREPLVLPEVPEDLTSQPPALHAENDT